MSAPASLAISARSSLDMMTSLVVRTWTTSTPYASSFSSSSSATCRVTSYSGTPVTTPAVPPGSTYCISSEPGPMGVSVRSAVAPCPASMHTTPRTGHSPVSRHSLASCPLDATAPMSSSAASDAAASATPSVARTG